MDGTQFYATIQQKLDDIAAEIKAAGAPKADIHIFCGSSYGKGITITMSKSNAYSTDSESLRGKDLDAMMQEYIRRTAFTKAQELLQIGAPVLDQ